MHHDTTYHAGGNCYELNANAIFVNKISTYRYYLSPNNFLLKKKGIRDGFFIATNRVARSTLHTRKLWLVGVATDRNARYL